MLTLREVMSTLEMLRNEHLDVRTVTLGINLFDCASHDPEKFRENIRKKITRLSQNLVPVCNEIGDKYGIPVVNKRISISPVAAVGASFKGDDLVKAAKTLDEIADEVKVDFIGGFSALVEKGMSDGDKNLIEAIPLALSETE